MPAPEPAPSKYGVGDRIEGNWLQKGHWYPGYISKRRSKGCYTYYSIDYDDGGKEAHVRAQSIRRRAPSPVRKHGKGHRRLTPHQSQRLVPKGGSCPDCHKILSRDGLKYHILHRLTSCSVWRGRPRQPGEAAAAQKAWKEAHAQLLAQDTP